MIDATDIIAASKAPERPTIQVSGSGFRDYMRVVGDSYLAHFLWNPAEACLHHGLIGNANDPVARAERHAKHKAAREIQAEMRQVRPR